MKVLICHNSYQLPGGEDAVVEAEFNLLKSNRVDVKKYIVSNQSIKGPLAKIKTGIFINYSATSKNNLAVELDAFKPDVVHFHNIFPLLTPSVYDACIERNIPVIQTLHNFRFICPTSLLMLRGKPCETSLRQSAYWAVPHKVYRNSFIGTFLLARMIEHHKKRKTWNNKVNRYIALTQFARRKFVAAGFPKERMAVKPNFSEPGETIAISQPKKSFALFVGRLSEEKGVRTLINAFKSIDVPLKIAGEGPLLESIKNDLPSHITLLGALDHESILSLMQEAQYLAMPSECYEGFPMVIAEAFAHRLPVLCSQLGAMAEIVSDNMNGLYFEAGNADDLAAKASQLFNAPEDCQRLGNQAYETYTSSYTPDVNFQHLIQIYKQAMIQ